MASRRGDRAHIAQEKGVYQRPHGRTIEVVRVGEALHELQLQLEPLLFAASSQLLDWQPAVPIVRSESPCSERADNRLTALSYQTHPERAWSVICV